MWDSHLDLIKFENNYYTQSGFLIKDISLSGIVTTNIKVCVGASRERGGGKTRERPTDLEAGVAGVL